MTSHKYQDSFISGCFTNITMISIGRHQKTVEFVFRINTFLITHFFIPLNSCLKPMLVDKLRNMMNCSRGSTQISVLFTFIRKGELLSEILLLSSKSGCNWSGQSSWLCSITLPSFVTALFIIILIIRSFVTMLSSIFLHRILGNQTRQYNLIVCTLFYQLTVSSPLKVVVLWIYSGQEATITLDVTPGFKTMLNSFLQSLVPSFNKKKPELIARPESERLRKATAEDLRGRTIYPYWPGSMDPRFSWFGNFNKDFEFI